MKSPQRNKARLAAGVCTLLLTPLAHAESPVLTSVLNEPAEAGVVYVSDEPTLAAAASAPGRVEIIRERFPDGKVSVEREVTLDENENYVNHGEWRMFDRQGNVSAEGRYHYGKRVGPWQRWHNASTSKTVKSFPFNRFKGPFLSQATYTDGVLDGAWIILDADNRKVMQVSIEDGKRHDVTITWSPGGDIIRQQAYEHGVPVGDVLELRGGAKEMERIATYLDGRKLVEKKANHPRTRNKKLVESYLEPKTVLKNADDFWTLTFAEYELQGEAVRHGLSQHWHPNGQLEQQGEYRMGEKVGRFTYWHANGQKRSEGAYADDKQDGAWVWWHANGQKAAIGHYAGGELVDRWRWWGENGQLAKQKAYGDSTISVAERDAPRLNLY
ncbi:MORN repeat variant [Pseudobythopirellula maris]|uniref:MORN repeat variant n=1 Tax=Pseudobythopirellula maris TaxID=2527991 RepID=A0A5C5ZK27_9BACT|nr:hypothetical protein [Pseudobythopirellula maris]TWT87712.1 MORN repeat variant [Pseudobythopirellula maris]